MRMLATQSSSAVVSFLSPDNLSLSERFNSEELFGSIPNHRGLKNFNYRSELGWVGLRVNVFGGVEVSVPCSWYYV